MARTLQVEIVGDSRSLEAALGRAAGASKTFGQKVQRGAGIAAAALGGGLVLAAKAGFDELFQGQKVAAQTEAVLKSTGGAANVTAGHVDDLAAAIMAKSGIDDEAIKSGENLLLTFTNIRNEAGKGNDIFDRTTEIMADMSVALGQDMKSSAIQLGKALNDPVRGVSALQRVGVSFTKAQKDQIKALVASGKTLDAQKLILRELNKEFGGSAEAAGKTLPGQLNIAKESFSNLAGDLVTLLLPAVQNITGGLNKMASFLTEHQGIAKVLAAALVGLAGALAVVSVATKVWRTVVIAATAVQWLWNAALAANPIGVVVVALVALGVALVVAYKKSETFRKIVDKAFEVVQKAFDATVKAVKKFADVFIDAIKDPIGFLKRNWPEIATILSGPFAPIVALATDAFGVRSALEGAIGGLLDWARQNWPEIATVLSGPFAPIVALATNSFGIRDALVTALGGLITDAKTKAGEIATGIINGIVGGLKTLATAITTKIRTAIDTVVGVTGLVSRIATVGGNIVTRLLAGIVGIAAGVKEKITAAVDAVVAAGGLVAKIATVGGWIVDRVVGGIIGLAGGVKGKIVDAVDVIVGLGSKVVSAIKAVGGWVKDSILDGLSGLGDALLKAVRSAVNAAIGIVNSGIRAINSALDFTIPGISLPGPLPDIPGVRVNAPDIPTIPAMAEGGIVKRPTLALIGERGPEAVIPLGRAAAATGVTINLHGPFYGDERGMRELTHRIRRELQRTEARNA